MSATSAYLFQAKGVSKKYPPTVLALDAIDFELRAGEVHALLGENGAGKSTLSRIIAGIEQPDTGVLTLSGRSYAPPSRKAAENLGVRIVMQELNLVGTMSVGESLFLDRLPSKFGFVDFKRLHSEAARVLEKVGLGHLNPGIRVSTLGIGQQQLVEIAAGLAVQCQVLILDEPTAALTQPEVELLFDQVAKLKSCGVGIIYISHRMEEISRIADRLTVLRDGRFVGTRERGAFDTAEIVQMMVGRALGNIQLRSKRVTNEIAMRVRGLRAGTAVREVSFDLFRGEILGFAGLMGSGRTETMRAIFGADSRSGGSVYLHGSERDSRFRSPHDAVAAGVALVTEDRKEEGLLLPLSIRGNITLSSLEKVMNPIGWIDREYEASAADEFSKKLGIRCSSVEQPVRELSGGNQQKVVIAKWLYRDCDILIFDEPTRGIDIGAKFEIYRLLVELAEQGKAVIVVSSELLELFCICNRIAVLSAGELVRIFESEQFNQSEIMTAALSNHSTSRHA